LAKSFEKNVLQISKAAQESNEESVLANGTVSQEIPDAVFTWASEGKPAKNMRVIVPGATSAERGNWR